MTSFASFANYLIFQECRSGDKCERIERVIIDCRYILQSLIDMNTSLYCRHAHQIENFEPQNRLVDKV